MWEMIEHRLHDGMNLVKDEESAQFRGVLALLFWRSVRLRHIPVKSPRETRRFGFFCKPRH